MEIAKDLPLNKYDVVVTMSGDGLVHEVMNGFASHKDPIRALRIPIAPVPVGSGNGLSLNLLGMEVNTSFLLKLVVSLLYAQCVRMALTFRLRHSTLSKACASLFHTRFEMAH